MEKLIFSLGLILSGLALGYVLQFLDRNQILSLPLPIANLRKLLQKIGLLFFMPWLGLVAGAVATRATPGQTHDQNRHQEKSVLHCASVLNKPARSGPRALKNT